MKMNSKIGKGEGKILQILNAVITHKSVKAVIDLIVLRVESKFNKSNTDSIAEHYTKSNKNDPLLRRYLFFISLTSTNKSLRQKALDKAKKDHDYSIHSLVNLIENIDIYKGS